ncbi:MAG: type IV secretion system DNA-binding domain-containing protein [Leptospirales bacterium]
MFGFKKKFDTLEVEGLKFPPGSELEHILIPATTGSGKTQLIHNLLNRILWGVDTKPGEKALITDSGGILAATRAGEKDLLLNPFDGRTVRWNPFAEIENDWDYAFVAQSCIPADGAAGQEADFRRHGQALLADIMRGLVREKNPNPREVQRLLSCLDPEALQPYLNGSESIGFLAPGNDRFFGSVAQVCSEALRSWSVLDPDGNFSIRKWVREGKGCLFLVYQDAQLAVIRPLVGAWLSLAIREVLSLNPDDSRRVWMVMDELDSLGTVSGLSDALTRGRKYGLATISAIQSIAQLRQRYGQDGAKVLDACFVNKLIMRQGSFEDAKHWSDDIGQVEEERITRTEGNSTGTGQASTNTGRSARRDIRQLVLPSELQGQTLDKFCGYARISGLPEIRKFRFQPQSWPEKHPAFVPKQKET